MSIQDNIINNVYTIKVTKECLEDLRDMINNPKKAGVAYVTEAELTEDSFDFKIVRWNGTTDEISIKLNR